jgi:enamine deaminase RidA (YjgF/YER057c/UK114 family)
MTLPTRHILAGFPPSVSPSSHAVESDGWVFLTGQFGRDREAPDAALTDDIATRTRRALGNMPKVLNGLGLDLQTVVSVRVFLTRFRDDYADLVPGARIEIACIARRP